MSKPQRLPELETYAHVGAVVLGSLGIVWVLISVLRTVVIPRPERVWLTAAAFEGARAAWTDFSGWRLNYDRSVSGLRELVGDLPTHWTHPDRQS